MAMGYISLFIQFALFIYWMNKSSFFSFGTLPKLYAYLALILKLGAALSNWFIYTYYYTDRIHSDIFKYFDDAVHLFNSAKGDVILRFKIIGGFQNDAEISIILADTSYWDNSSELYFNDNSTMIRFHLALLH